MAMVPDLGSDFAQKLLRDLRRRREKLGFDSSSAQRSASNASATPRDDRSNSQKQLPSQNQQGAPRVRRPEATTHRSHQQGSNAITRPGKPRHRDALITHSHDIVPFQGGRGSNRQKPANNIDVQMALALALSNSGKLQNIEVVARNGSIFFREPDRTQMHSRREGYHMSPNAHVGKVAIGVQKLNDILLAYSSGGGARDFSRRSSFEIGKKLFRGAMDLEESLSMLVMLQEASDYMEGSGNGKVLLLKGKENRKSSPTHSSSSARLVEITDEYSETEQDMNGKSTSNASMQIVSHNSSHSRSSNSNSVLQFSSVPDNPKISLCKAEKDGSKVRVPSVIAKLMGLENLPSVKVTAEHKRTVKFVKPEAVPRKEIKANAMGSKLPIRIVASERVFPKGQNKDLLAREWKIDMTNFEEYERATALSNSSSQPTTNKQVNQTLQEVSRKIERTERGDENQGVNEIIIHQNKRLVEENKTQKPVGVGCRSDAGTKMDFLRRFRKNSGNKSVIEEKYTTQEKSETAGKKQTTNMKQLPGRDSETKSRRSREKFNKENLASTDTKTAGKNGRTDHMKRKAHNKHIDKQSIVKKSPNHRIIQSEIPSLNLEEKKSLKSEAAHMKNKLAHNVAIPYEDHDHAKVNNISSSKRSDKIHGDHSVSEQLARVVEDSSTKEVASSDQTVKQAEEIDHPTVAVVLQTSEDSEVLHQSASAKMNDGRTDHTDSETTEMLQTFAEGEQQPEEMTMKEQPMDGLDHAEVSCNPTDLEAQKMHVVSCDSFTENQQLVTKMLMKDQYLLETAKAIVRIHVPVNFVKTSTNLKWSDKGNDLLSDVGREVIRRKGKRVEAMEQVSMRCTAGLKLRCLDDLIRESDGDIESLNISKKLHQPSDDNCTAEILQMILHRDIQNNHPDANSTWDFGWNRIRDLTIKKTEVIKDLEKNILGSIITDVAKDLIEASLRHGGCPCEA